MKSKTTKDESNGGGITIETSSLADPFDLSEAQSAPKQTTPAAKSDDKPKDGSKVQLKRQ